MNDPLISIVVPVYNVESYLRKCLDSLANQTNKDFEVILVDDGSKDSSGEICDEFANNDSRFRVFHNENAGPGAARNFGITRAKGKYLLFVDSDDWIEKEYIEIIKNAMHSDLLYFGMRALSKERAPYYYYMPHVNEENSFEDKLFSMLIHQKSYYDFAMVANKCFVKEVIDKNNITFPTDIFHSEDEVFTLRYFVCIRSFQCIDDVLYNYNQRNNSLSVHIYPEEYYRICNYQYSISEKFENRNIKSFLKTRWLYFFYRNYKINKNHSNEIIAMLKSIINQSDIYYLSIPFNSLRHNRNLFPTENFVAFARDIILFSKYRLLFFYSGFLLKLRESFQETCSLVKYEFNSKLLRKG